MTSQSVLIIKHGALGDLIQATGVMKDIRHAYPQANITLLTSQTYLRLMQRFQWIDQILVDNRAPIWNLSVYFSLGKLFKQQPFDLVIDLQNSKRTRFYHSLWFKKTKWIGRSSAAPGPVSGFQGMVDLLQNNHIPTVNSHQPDLNWMVHDIEPLFTQWNFNRPYIVLIPGSSAKNKEKRWPHYAALTKQLQRENLNVVCVVGPDESDLIEMFNCKVLQNLDWFSLASLLKNASFVIGNDTGPTHIAAHVGAKGVAIFGPKNPAKRAQITRENFQSLELDNLNYFDAKAMHAWLRKNTHLFVTFIS